MRPESFRNSMVTSSLMGLCILVTVISTVFPAIGAYGIHSLFLATGDYAGVLIQTVLYQFIHGWVFHLLSNLLFLAYFWPGLEQAMGSGKYFVFFLFNTVFTAIFLMIFASGNTVGISGFAMAILASVTIRMYHSKHPEYKSGLLFLFINIAIGLSGSISLAWHLGGAIAGAIWQAIDSHSMQISRFFSSKNR